MSHSQRAAYVIPLSQVYPSYLKVIPNLSSAYVKTICQKIKGLDETFLLFFCRVSHRRRAAYAVQGRRFVAFHYTPRRSSNSSQTSALLKSVVYPKICGHDELQRTRVGVEKKATFTTYFSNPFFQTSEFSFGFDDF